MVHWVCRLTVHELTEFPVPFLVFIVKTQLLQCNHKLILKDREAEVCLTQRPQ